MSNPIVQELADSLAAEAKQVNTDWEKPVNPIDKRFEDKQAVINKEPVKIELKPDVKKMLQETHAPSTAPVKTLGYDA